MPQLHHIFKALADPNRLRILNLLLEEPSCVCELEAALVLPQSRVSRHLAYLRGAGLVEDRRRGMRVEYSAARQPGIGRAWETFLTEAFRQVLAQAIRWAARR